MKHLIKKIILSVVLSGLIGSQADAYFGSWYDSFTKNSCVDYVSSLKKANFSTTEFNVAAGVLGLAAVGTMARYATTYYYAHNVFQEVGGKFGNEFATSKFKYATWRMEETSPDPIWKTIPELFNNHVKVKDCLLVDSPQCKSGGTLQEKKNAMLEKIAEEKIALESFMKQLEPFTNAHVKILKIYENNKPQMINLMALQLPVDKHSKVMSLVQLFVDSYRNPQTHLILRALDAAHYADECGGLYIKIYSTYIRLHAIECLVKSY